MFGVIKGKLAAFYEERWGRLQAEHPSLSLAQIDSAAVYDRLWLQEGEEVRWMLVGEAPGGEEARQGRPFVGQAGQNLARLLQRVGLSRRELLITNAFPFRTYALGERGAINRTPTTAELKAGVGLLLEEIALVQPQAIILLGLSARRAFAMAKAPWSAEVKQMKLGESIQISVGDQNLPLMLSYHPSPLNYNVHSKREALERFFDSLAAER